MIIQISIPKLKHKDFYLFLLMAVIVNYFQPRYVIVITFSEQVFIWMIRDRTLFFCT